MYVSSPICTLHPVCMCVQCMCVCTCVWMQVYVCICTYLHTFLLLLNDGETAGQWFVSDHVTLSVPQPVGGALTPSPPLPHPLNHLGQILVPTIRLKRESESYNTLCSFT